LLHYDDSSTSDPTYPSLTQQGDLNLLLRIELFRLAQAASGTENDFKLPGELLRRNPQFILPRDVPHRTNVKHLRKGTCATSCFNLKFYSSYFIL